MRMGARHRPGSVPRVMSVRCLSWMLLLCLPPVTSVPVASGDESVAGSLTHARESTLRDLRDRAVGGDAAATSALGDQLQAPDATVRLLGLGFLLDACRSADDPATRTSLVKRALPLLEDPDERIRANCEKGLLAVLDSLDIDAPTRLLACSHLRETSLSEARILLAGHFNCRDLARELEKVAMGATSTDVDPRVRACRMALARMGRRGLITGLLQQRSQDPEDPVPAELIARAAYIRQPEAADYLMRQLNSDGFMPRGDDHPAVYASHLAMTALARMIEGFPFTNVARQGISDADVERCRVWTREHRASWKIRGGYAWEGDSSWPATNSVSAAGEAPDGEAVIKRVFPR
jgi:hypothetical protein